MKNKKVLALVLSLAMVVSMLTACGEKEQKPNNDTTGVSLDFEDSKSGFALIKTAPRKADESTISVKEINNSKVLYVKNEQGADEMYLTLDLDGLLGANITKLAKIEFSIGVDRPGVSKFASIAGETFVHAGESAEKLAETKIGVWSVYTAGKNPMTVSYDVSGVTFTAGADSYLTIMKKEDTSTTEKGNIYIDNVKFLDKDGKLIDVDKNAIMEPVGKKFLREPEVPDVSAGVTFKDPMVPEGEWKQDCVVPAGFFNGFEGPVELTIKYELIAGDAGYLCWGLCDKDWKKLTKDVMTPDAAIVSSSVPDNGDGLFAIDREATELKVVLSPEAVAALNAGFFGLTYHVDVYEITAKPAGAGSIKETVKDEVTPDDWAMEATVPVDVLAKFGGDVKVTLKYEHKDGLTYGKFKPMTNTDGWPAISKLVEGAIKDAPEGALGDDGFFTIDYATAPDTFTFTLSAEAVAYYVAEKQPFCAQVAQIDVYEIVLEGEPKQIATETVKDEVTPDDWAMEATVPVDVLAKFVGDVKVTLKFEHKDGLTYGKFKPMTNTDGWPAISKLVEGAIKDAPEGALGDDGFFTIDYATAPDTFTFTLSAEAVAYYVAEKQPFCAQVAQIDVFEIVLEGEQKGTITEKVKDEVTPDDWAMEATVPVDVLAKFGGDVKVTLKYEHKDGLTYGKFKPMTNTDGWPAISKLVEGAIKDAPEGALGDDGFFTIDYGTAPDTFTFTLSAEAVAYYVAEKQPFCAQVAQIDVFEIVLEGAAK